jgi:hypothetical protein
MEVAGCTKSLMIAIDIDHISGKEAIEFINIKRKLRQQSEDSIPG